MVVAYIGVGSNLGNRKRNILNAQKLIKSTRGIKLTNCSSIYETEPWGYKNQRKFLNTVWEIETKLSPERLLNTLKKIEKRLGRVKSKIRWGPRTIDLDILFYGKKKINKKNLKIPHPQVFKRDFVLKGLLDLAPEYISYFAKKMKQ